MIQCMCALLSLFYCSFLFAPATLPPGVTRLADVDLNSWLLIAVGFVVELAIIYFLLRKERESLVKVFGVTVFMNVVSVFMGSVAVLAADMVVNQLMHAPLIISFAVIYCVAVFSSVFTECLIALKLFANINRFKLIFWLTIANMASIAMGMYGIWITKY